MEQGPVRELKVRAAEAMRLGDLEGARERFLDLERREPDQPAWPRRLADVHRRLGERGPELRALLRAAELYAAGGFAIQAVATCRMIRSIDPRHTATQQRLDDLATALPHEPSPGGEGLVAVAKTADGASPLEEIPLIRAIPGARPHRFEGETLDGVFEIPLDGTSDEGEIDLALPPGELAGELDEPEDLEPGGREFRPECSPRDRLRGIPLFGSLDGGALRWMIDRVRLLEIAQSEVLFRQGDPGNALYVVVDGGVAPIAESEDDGQPSRTLGVLEAGEFFGELALVADRPRHATVRMVADTRLLEIDRATVWDWIRERPEILGVVLRFLRERLVDRLVRSRSLFSPFARVDRARLARSFRLLEIQDASQLIQQDQSAHALFLILSGRMDLIRTDDDGDKMIAALGPGDLCGERSLLLREPALGTVESSGKCWALALSESRFRRICDRNPQLQKVIDRELERGERERADIPSNEVGRGDRALGLI